MGESENCFSCHTELRRLRESEEHLRRLSENLADGMVYQIDTGVAGEMRQFTYISSTVERFHGVTVSAALENAAHVYNTIVADDLERVASIEEKAVLEAQTFRAEAQMKRPDGTIRWALLISEPHRDERGHLIFDGIELDIHERKIAELRLAQNEDNFRRLVEGLGKKYCLFSHKKDGTFLYVSKSFKALFDVSADDIIGKDWRMANLTEESICGRNEADAHIFSDKTNQSVELTCIHSDGSEHIIEVNYGPVIENMAK